MCLYLKNTKKYTASENIEVFKRFLKPSRENTKTIVTPYMNKRLHKNKLLETKIGKIMPSVINVNGYIDQGFHSYSKLSTATNRSRLHSPFTGYEVIYCCIIPKGAEYYIGKGDEIVSNQLIIINQILTNKY